MARNSADGSMWDKAITANPLRDNGATVLMGGSIDSSPTVTSAPDMTITGAGRRKQPGVTESATANIGTTTANSSGNFAVLATGKYIVKGGNITTELAGVAYRGLRGAGNQNQIRGIHTLLTRSTVLITSWNYATGEATFAGGNPSSDNFGTVSGTHTVPTRALPGNVVITDFDGLDPSVVALPAKTG